MVERWITWVLGDCEYVSNIKLKDSSLERQRWPSRYRWEVAQSGGVPSADPVTFSPLSGEAIQNSQMVGRRGWPTVIGEAPDEIQIQSSFQACG